MIYVPNVCVPRSCRERDSKWKNKETSYKVTYPAHETPAGAPLTKSHRNLDRRETVG